jgi:hypothetical protein
LLSQTLHEYLGDEAKRQKDKGQKVYPAVQNVRLLVPFSFRQPCKDLKDVQLHNDFGMIPLDVTVNADFKECLVEAKAKFNSLKTSLLPFAMYITACFINLTPVWVAKPTQDFLTSKFTSLYSNVVTST